MFSCAPDTNDNQALKEEVIAIHDEVMPKMGTLKFYQKRLTEEADQLSELDSVQYQDEIQKRRHLARELDQAYEGMFIWMRQFRPNLEDMEDEEARKYLQEQKSKVTKVNEDIKNSLAKAEEMDSDSVGQVGMM